MINSKIRYKAIRFVVILLLFFTIGWWFYGKQLNVGPPVWNLVLVLSITGLLSVVLLESNNLANYNNSNSSDQPDLWNVKQSSTESLESSNSKLEAMRDVVDDIRSRVSNQKDHQSPENKKKVISMSDKKIRVYASIEDGQNHGWLFSDQIAVYNDRPIYAQASLGSDNWIFDGLVTDLSFESIYNDSRSFGKLKYKLLSSEKDSITVSKVRSTDELEPSEMIDKKLGYNA